MIRSLSGRVISADGEIICLDVSGFGLEVYGSGSLMARAKPGDLLTCAAYLQTSDSGFALFGFSDEVERTLFLEITQVKTMGGKLSIALLRHLGSGEIISAILAGDSARLAVPGLGPKRAERICFELRSKAEKKFASFAGASAPLSERSSVDSGVMEGLAALGFTQSEAVQAISACRAEGGERSWTEEDLMKSALGRLQRR
ncbi:MAG: Holliday junction branch migration protein RuvA [Synergistaceae bacterium]|jgi:Holliday junction DNA helicase RuvA|nr:Holliday junction branch migration protein RuvA [Synergistaceae bacterium]